MGVIIRIKLYFGKFLWFLVCNYKGKDYVVGDKWDDGCDLFCECLANGVYSCK